MAAAAPPGDNSPPQLPGDNGNLTNGNIPGNAILHEDNSELALALTQIPSRFLSAKNSVELVRQNRARYFQPYRSLPAFLGMGAAGGSAGAALRSSVESLDEMPSSRTSERRNVIHSSKGCERLQLSKPPTPKISSHDSEMTNPRRGRGASEASLYLDTAPSLDVSVIRPPNSGSQDMFDLGKSSIDIEGLLSEMHVDSTLGSRLSPGEVVQGGTPEVIEPNEAEPLQNTFINSTDGFANAETNRLQDTTKYFTPIQIDVPSVGHILNDSKGNADVLNPPKSVQPSGGNCPPIVQDQAIQSRYDVESITKQFGELFFKAGGDRCEGSRPHCSYKALAIGPGRKGRFPQIDDEVDLDEKTSPIVLKTAEDICVPDPDYLSTRVPENLRSQIVNVYKKDCRTWLWKSKTQRAARLRDQRQMEEDTAAAATQLIVNQQNLSNNSSIPSSNGTIQPNSKGTE